MIITRTSGLLERILVWFDGVGVVLFLRGMMVEFCLFLCVAV